MDENIFIKKMDEIIAILKRAFPEERVIDKGMVETPIRKAPKTYTIDAAKKYRVADKTCRYCGGKVSWDLYPHRKAPLHVDDDGFVIENGDCPNYE